MKTLAIATTALGLAFTASPALADQEERLTVSISTEGLDLSSPEGQRILEERIDRAAREVCQVNRVPTGTRIRRHSNNACVAKARASAKHQIATIIEDQRRGG